jgi:hypothetical protein
LAARRGERLAAQWAARRVAWSVRRSVERTVAVTVALSECKEAAQRVYCLVAWTVAVMAAHSACWLAALTTAA